MPYESFSFIIDTGFVTDEFVMLPQIAWKSEKGDKMEFQNSYFESEVREGFFVTSMVKRSWAAQLEILEEVDRVCQKHGIVYYADAGTFLGAVRHQGFIPWDDDMDICMLREDYNRFIAIAQSELPDGYILRNIHTDDTYEELFTRVLNSRHINFQPDFLRKYHGCPYGMGIDVFVMDYLPADPDERNSFHAVLQLIAKIVENVILGHLQGEQLAAQLHALEDMLHVKIDASRPCVHELLLLEEKLFSMYPADEADEITMMPEWVKQDAYRWKRCWYDHTKRVPFENTTVPVPVMHDAVLWKKYGDYMHPVKNAGMHEYPLFQKQEDSLIGKVGKSPYTYVFSEDASKVLYGADNVKTQTVKTQIRQKLQAMNQLHDTIKDWKNNEDPCFGMLSACQETAIALGTLLEHKMCQPDAAVHSLEDYCENLYQMHEAILQKNQAEAERLLKLLETGIRQTRLQITKEMDLRSIIVFLPYHASKWAYMESIWEAARKDEDCIPYVIPVPYFYKESDGTAGELRTESDQFPEYVPVTDYHTIDLAGLRPDVIYIQNAYDEFDPAMSVYPYFYAANLKQYTDQLIYIPPYLVDEITAEDERAIKNIRYSCAVPGVVYADKVIVQSEGMRQIYIDILTEFAGAATREKWEEKILGLGSPKLDQNNRIKKEESELPAEWLAKIKKPDESWKKIVLYGTNEGILLQKPVKMLDKIRRVLALFEENCEEVALLWMTFGLEGWRDNKSDIPEQWSEYQTVRSQFQKAGWGILDTSLNVQRAVMLCDAYYGDRGYAAQLCLDRKIPVMLQNEEV